MKSQDEPAALAPEAIDRLEPGDLTDFSVPYITGSP